MTISDINFTIGSVNPSGIADEIYFCPKQYITAWPTITNDFTTATSAATYAGYTGSFTMRPERDNVFSRLYNTQGKGKISWEYTGETDCKVVVNKATLSYPKFTDDIRAFAKFASNGDFVFIVKHDGKYYVIGCDDYRATVTPNGDSGDTAGSAKGVTIEIECPDVTPLPTYVGTLALADGILNCSTGAFTPTGD